VKLELINTGTELMLGFVTNTNHQWLCRELTQAGYVVSRQVAVPDSAPEIQQAIREALTRVPIVVTTGGLGPTSDDLTRQAIAQLFGRALREDAAVVAHIDRFFRDRGRTMPPQTRVQALVPEGALVLPNSNGTAPGLAMELGAAEGEGAKLLVMLPGPPRELEPMFVDQALPLLRARYPNPASFACRTLRSVGIGESLVEAAIAGPLQALVAAGLEIGYCARIGEVDVRLSARGATATGLVADAEQIVLSLIGKHIFGADRAELHGAVIQALAARGETLAVAESCTGGYLAHRLTNVPGASEVFLGGWITYSNRAKQEFLGVKPETLAAHGAVSEAVAREMAEGARERMKASYALAITGIAGPAGGGPDKPVGTVYLGLASSKATRVLHQVNRYDRESFKFVTSQQALELLRRRLVS
jgi:nicotinamide-nucleotide amidase